MSKRIELVFDDKVTIAVIKDAKLTDEQLIQEGVAELIELVTSREYPYVVINFACVEFLGTNFLGGLVTVKNAAARHGTYISLCSISELIMEAIHIVAFERIFAIYPNQSEAIKALK